MDSYIERSNTILARLFGPNFTPEILMKIGAFIVAYGLFETGLERALLALKEVDVKGQRPFTEKLSANAQIAMLGEGHPRFSPECNAVLKMTVETAEDLCDYRNSLVHGYMIAIGGTPSFLRNPRWNGEERNKAVGDAYLNEPFQDLALVAAWALVSVVRHAEKALSVPSEQKAIEDLKTEIRRARSYISELRHVRSYMNHEKN